jgi:ABC-2 type transport system ATP-binding protein
MLQITEVSKHYGSKIALDRINLSIDGGKIFGLLGPNGAGKTTLIRIITQITAPDAGQINFTDQSNKTFSQSDIGYLPEERGLYRKMPIIDQAYYFAELKGMKHADATQAINHWFTKLEMTDWKRKNIEELSKGMQQKVQFALTVLHQPKLLILDEPFTGFDPINAEIIKNEIIALKKQGTSIILSTHRMESVETLCDEIGLINQGKVIISGEIKSIKNQFSSKSYCIKHRNPLHNNSDYLITHSEEKENYIESFIQLQRPFENNNQLLEKLMTAAEILHFSEIVPSINDIFIHLIKNSAA